MPRATVLAILIFVVVFVFGCASWKKTPEPPTQPDTTNTSAPQPPYSVTDAPAFDLPLPDGEWKAIAHDFRPELATWSEKNSNANYSKVAKQAQKFIDSFGLIFQVNVKDLASKFAGYKSLSSPNGQIVHFSTTKTSSGTCGESFVSVSVLGFENGQPIVLTNYGPKTVDGLKLNTLIIRNSEAEENKLTLYRPEAAAPWNIGPDGKSIFWQYDLRQSVMLKWWQKLARRYRELREERPYAIVRINKEKFIVETSDKSLLPPAYEQVNPNQPQSPHLIRRVYKPRQIVVDYDGPCN